MKFEIDRAELEQFVESLRLKHPDEKLHDGFKVQFDADGNLSMYEIEPTMEEYNYNVPWNHPDRRKTVPNPNYGNDVENMRFVDAIKFVDIENGKPRLGHVKFVNLDGRDTYVSFRHFNQDIAKHMVKGWVVGQFEFTQFCGYCYIKLVKVLW